MNKWIGGLLKVYFGTISFLVVATLCIAFIQSHVTGFVGLIVLLIVIAAVRAVWTRTAL